MSTAAQAVLINSEVCKDFLLRPGSKPFIPVYIVPDTLNGSFDSPNTYGGPTYVTRMSEVYGNARETVRFAYAPLDLPLEKRQRIFSDTAWLRVDQQNLRVAEMSVDDYHRLQTQGHFSKSRFAQIVQPELDFEFIQPGDTFKLHNQYVVFAEGNMWALTFRKRPQVGDQAIFRDEMAYPLWDQYGATNSDSWWTKDTEWLGRVVVDEFGRVVETDYGLKKPQLDSVAKFSLHNFRRSGGTAAQMAEPRPNAPTLKEGALAE